MKAYYYYQYGTPEVLRLEEVEIPQPRNNELLIQLKALSINPAEWHKLTASFWLLRLSTGLFRPKNPGLGADVAGTVVAVGKNVTKFREGDRVFGRGLSGGLAEYCCLDESVVAKIPDHLPYEQAAALIALRDKGQVKAGQKVLINGASGGIGTFALQLAKYFKAHVTGVCSTDNVALVKSLGADEVVDYKKQDLSTLDSRFDLIIDLVGNKNISQLKNLLVSTGKCILVGMDTPGQLLSNMFKGMLITALGSKTFLPMDAQVRSSDLDYLAALSETAQIRPVIDKLFNFTSVPEAFRHLGTRRSKGKLIIQSNTL
jgi:NADPH:quinone reductase-like Zn-dependent oxidoreductase